MNRSDYLALVHVANAATAFWTWQAAPQSQRGGFAAFHLGLAIAIELLRCP